MTHVSNTVSYVSHVFAVSLKLLYIIMKTVESVLTWDILLVMSIGRNFMKTMQKMAKQQIEQNQQ